MEDMCGFPNVSVKNQLKVNSPLSSFRLTNVRCLIVFNFRVTVPGGV